MLFVVLAMIVTLAVAALVLTYAAWPSRGRSLPANVPAAKWLDQAMGKVVDLEPALGPELGLERDAHQDSPASLVR